MAKQNFIEKAFDVQRKEWRTLVWLLLFMFTESVASEILDIVAVAGVLKKGGIRNLPILYLVDEVILSMVLAVYAALQSKMERTRLFNLLEATFGSLVLLLWVGGNFATPAGLLSVAMWGLVIGIGTYAVKSMAISVVEECFWQFVDDIYDVRESKRLTSVITNAGTVGSIVAGFGLGLITPLVGKNTNVFRLVAPIVMFSGIFFMNRVRAAAIADGRIKDKAKKKEKAGKKKKKEEEPTFRAGVQFIGSSPLFGAVFWTFVIAGVVAPLGDFLFQATIDMAAKDEGAFTRFYAFYKSGLQIVIIAAQFLLAGRLMKKLGISRSQLFTPINNVLKFALFVPLVNRFNAIYSQGSKKLLEKVIQKPAQRILFGFAPKKQKNLIRIFTKRMKGYAAILTLASLFVTLKLMPAGFEDLDHPGQRITLIKVVAVILVVLNAVWLYYAVRLKRTFADSLVQILQTQEVDFEALEREDFRQLIDSKTLMFLWKNLEAGSDERAMFITEVLGEMGDTRLLRPIADLMPHKSPPVRRALVKLAGRIGGEDARPFLLNALKSREAGIRCEALRAIRKNEYSGVAELARPLVDDSDEDVRVAAAAIILASEEVELKKEGARVLDAMLNSDDPRRRCNAIYLLGEMGVRRNLRSVSPFLGDPDPEVRLEAVRAVEKLAEATDEATVDGLIAMLDDPDQQVRAEAARVLGRVGSEKAVGPLLGTLSQRGFAVKRAAIEAMAALSQASREELASVVANPEVDLSTKELILRELRHTDEEEHVRQRLVPILTELLKGIYERIGDVRALRALAPEGMPARPGVQLLLKALADVNLENRDLVLSIMIILADPDRYKLIRKGLLAGDRSTKANMLELLESTSERTVFNLLMPLLEDVEEEERLAVGRKTWGLEPRDSSSSLHECLASSDPSIRLAAIYVTSEVPSPDLQGEVRKLAASTDEETAAEARRALAHLA